MPDPSRLDLQHLAPDFARQGLSDLQRARPGPGANTARPAVASAIRIGFTMTAAQLKRWRARLHLTQESAAAKLGVSRRAFQQWESGSSKIPGYVAMAASAVSMNLPPSEG